MFFSPMPHHVLRLDLVGIATSTLRVQASMSKNPPSTGSNENYANCSTSISC